MTPQITFRNATIEDLGLLLHWDQQQHVIDSDPDETWNWAYELPRTFSWREMLIAMLDDRPIGFVQIIDPALEETHYWGKDIGSHQRAIDIWIGEAEDLNKGYGTIMMQLALDRCFEDERVTRVLIDPLESNTKAIRFYKRLGFTFVEKENLKGHPIV